MTRRTLTCLAVLLVCIGLQLQEIAAEPHAAPRCDIVPLADQQVLLRIDGRQVTRWHAGSDAPRPFFFPFNGPSGASLTRMGHPGAPNHDHHRSVWFAHHDVEGVSFWSDQSDARIRQKQWYAYVDGEDEAVLAVGLGWYDGDGRELISQDVIAALRPLPDGESALEIQTTLRPAGDAKSVQLGKTNFGFLAVRVAKSLSVHFGGGAITNSEGQRGEAEIFGKPAKWMDYSGPITSGEGKDRKTVTEGITYFDHPTNPRYPTRWHVREDGWMGASFCMTDGYEITAEAPLRLRYLLHAHSGACDAERTGEMHKKFSTRPPFTITKSQRPHRQYEVERE